MSLFEISRDCPLPGAVLGSDRSRETVMTAQNASERIVEICLHYAVMFRHEMKLLETGKRHIYDDHGIEVSAARITELSSWIASLESTIQNEETRRA
jgi:hypothetical protein